MGYFSLSTFCSLVFGRLVVLLGQMFTINLLHMSRLPTEYSHVHDCTCVVVGYSVLFMSAYQMCHLWLKLPRPCMPVL